MLSICLSDIFAFLLYYPSVISETLVMHLLLLANTEASKMAMPHTVIIGNSRITMDYTFCLPHLLE